MSDAAAPCVLDPCSQVAMRLEAARRLGCEITELDPQTGHLNEIGKDGRAVVLFGSISPLNDAGALMLATDKFHAASVLAAAGHRVPQGVRCLRPGRFADPYASHTGLHPALALLERHGPPLVVKPNAGSRGRDVTLVHDAEALRAAVERVWRDDYLALVQRPVPGADLRLDYLDDDCVMAYVRRPVRLRGDGQRRIHELFTAADPRLHAAWCADRLPHEPAWQRLVQAHGYTVDTVLPEGRTICLEDVILNLNRVCTCERLDPVPEPWRAFGLAIGRRLRLRHFGVDLKIDALDRDPTHAVVIEVNASPSLANMARLGCYEEVVAIEERIVAAILAGASAG